MCVLCEPSGASACTASYNATRDPRWGHLSTRRRDALYRGRFPWFCLILHCFGVLSRDRAPAKRAERKCKMLLLSRLARPFRQSKNFDKRIIIAACPIFFEGRECLPGHIPGSRKSNFGWDFALALNVSPDISPGRPQPSGARLRSPSVTEMTKCTELARVANLLKMTKCWKCKSAVW